MTTVTITTCVDVDLEEFSDEDLIEEMESRGLGVGTDDFMTHLFIALKLGQKEKVYDLCKSHVEQLRGCIL